ncbi:hypothetical protein FISHEDRAFT_34005 [Fistulina hepatica ATCC 64428]|uniref:SEC7 domain-containing protein n=1 Tax=Fistulina hepatica ATCC 64428 TaxID=1128425 RepID=A0A0D7AMY3_9AGAR|nr:hypothetical protein FISHEDRAFT_34005 [Fistulina hepatica ATCC 64428]
MVSGLGPGDKNRNGRPRTAGGTQTRSRNSADFESALRGQDTVKLVQSPDLDTLGITTPSSMRRHSPSTPSSSRTPSVAPPDLAVPSTPNVLPPTPTPGPGLASSSTSSHDIFFDAGDNERATHRRSLYRSPGTSSSPDLATLLRKTRERGGTVVGHHAAALGKRREPPPPLPNGQPTTPFRSSTSRHKLTRPKQDSPEPSPLKGKLVKSSMRQKTSAFWGKVFQSSVRERSKTDASAPPSPAQPSAMNVFPPPVPLVPSRSPSPRGGGEASTPIADVFSTTSKPLPPIVIPPNDVDASEVATPMPGAFIRATSSDATSPAAPSTTRTMKRRSASVGQVDLAGLKLQDNDAGSFSGMISDFQGALSSLGPSTYDSLHLRDPTSSAAQSSTARADAMSTPIINLPDRPPVRSSSLTTPSPPKRAPGRQTRPASMTHPTRSSTTSYGHAPSLTLRSQNIGNSSRSSASPASPLSGAHLRIMHRSTASSSEPSLIPVGDESCPPPSYGRRSSHQDLSARRFSAISQLSKSGDGDVDIDTRAKELAMRCWNEDEEFLAREKIAEWLGGQYVFPHMCRQTVSNRRHHSGVLNKIALHHYIALLDFCNLRLDKAFRRLCSKLYLKGETQQVDRILEEFSKRYWECNPASLYGSANIVHAVSYSLLLLNTDLHVADLTNRMSRGQFVRNTIEAIRMQLSPSSPPAMSTQSSAGASTSDINDDVGSTKHDSRKRTQRSDSITSWNSISTSAHTNPNGSILSMPRVVESKPPQKVYGRAWESEMESLLKEMYNAIKNQQILQPLNTSNLMATRPSTSSLSPGGNMMARNRSTRSPNDRFNNLRRGSIRGLQSIIVQSGASPYSSNSSIDGRVSPSPSFATSTNEAFFGSSSSFLQPTLGFASNLSHTIIREAQEDDDRSLHSVASTSTNISITDEELALLGAPWAKEGMLCRKQYWESTGKRAKNKAWLDVFVVIQKGELSMFTFGESGEGQGGVVGGGNWLSNARPVGTVQLAHALANALPPPGYNRSRPHCMVLTLSNGCVYFFQAGTEELVNEWVSTCNYWAARTSKEPLAGGVSNMEYGWNRVVEEPCGQDELHSPSHSDGQFDAISITSGRSNRSKFSHWREGAATLRASPSPWVGERLYINDWKPPMPPTVSSTHDEETQLEALRKHAAHMKTEIKQHNDLREPMTALYQPRSSNASKALSNWERKSQYLLTEIVKYDSYIDSLQAAMALRLKKRGDKGLYLLILNTGFKAEVCFSLGESIRFGQSRRRLYVASLQDLEWP